ncbi:MAG: NAD-dependent epimerase [Cyclobacteriaceae bacterium]|nr:MAG: NAD-dependent epimerase [Cyclobacteriaceae bacterium]
MKNVLVTGACGQLGSELSLVLEKMTGTENLVISDICRPPAHLSHLQFLMLDILDEQAVKQVIEEHSINVIFHLAAMLSATGEHRPRQAWTLNMEGLINVLDAARTHKVDKVFWPSSIAAFGSHTQLDKTPQHTIMDPETIYGISKLSGELWCKYYVDRFAIDVRSIRFPGLISYKSPPGGGTTDYAVAIFHQALKGEDFECFLGENTRLPMMYMPDAVEAIFKLMQAPKESISVRSYNLAAFSVTPGELTLAIQKHFPHFSTRYNPDFRDLIAKTWPSTIDDSVARNDWGWQPQYELSEVVNDMVTNLRMTIDD